MSDAPLYSATFSLDTENPTIIEAEIREWFLDRPVARVRFSMELLQQVIAEAVEHATQETDQ